MTLTGAAKGKTKVQNIVHMLAESDSYDGSEAGELRVESSALRQSGYENTAAVREITCVTQSYYD